MPKFEEIKEFLAKRAENRGGIFCYLPKLSVFQKKEINFHDQISNDEEEIHQLKSFRNRYYHDYFKKRIFQLPTESVILEIGSGSGCDILEIARRGYKVIVSDISEVSVFNIKKKAENNIDRFGGDIIYLVSDGQNLPLPDKSIDCLFMVASLHHFEHQNNLLGELKRVIKNSGKIIFAMEPSKFMMGLTRLFSYCQVLRIHQGFSEADETHQGYSFSDFKKMGAIKIKRVWFLLGFLHYGLEFLFRFLKLKKRIIIPFVFEYILFILDEIILKIPFLNRLNWHWIVIL